MSNYHLATADVERAYQQALHDLLAERVAAGHWEGELSSSPLSTATAISALVVSQRSAVGNPPLESDQFDRLILPSLDWLAARQNDDGGWGDTDRSFSNIATTYLVRSAFQLSGTSAQHTGMLERAERYCDTQGGIEGLRRRYGRDKTFAVPILTNAAIAGLVPWREVSPLPFEFAALPQSWYRFLQLPVVSYAIPALVAIGYAKFVNDPPQNPLASMIRSKAVEPGFRVLDRLQPASGGFLEATPLTSFVVMSLASSGRGNHPVAARGVRFLLDSRRKDGSWPIDTNLSMWTTSWSLTAGLGRRGTPPPRWITEDTAQFDRCIAWLLDGQHQQIHPYTGALPGGWAWTDLSGGVMDVDDTSAALIALARYVELAPLLELSHRQRVERSGQLGVEWLLGVQNRDGGWPTFCRGWGKLAFDRSSADLTAHAVRALSAWRELWSQTEIGMRYEPRIRTALDRGHRFLLKQQREDGSWVPLWFGNQHNRHEENPVYGTARVLIALADLGWTENSAASRGSPLADCSAASWWGLGIVSAPPGTEAMWRKAAAGGCSVEETGLALAALARFAQMGDVQQAITKGHALAPRGSVCWKTPRGSTDRFLFRETLVL